MTQPNTPLQARQDFPDRLRGIALLGIVVVNAPFLGLSATGFTPASASGAFNAASVFLVTAFAQFKFYLLFAFLFGYSSQFILRANGPADRRRFRRRLVALFALGIVHATFFFVGDILMTYAVLGFGLLALNGASYCRVRAVALGSLAVGITLAVVIAVLALASPESVTADPALAYLNEALAHGSFVDAALARLEALPSTLTVTFFLQGPFAFAAFCAGLLAGRSQLLAGASVPAARWRRWTFAGLGLGLPLQIGGAVVATWALVAGEDGHAWVAYLVGAATAPVLAFGYVSILGWMLARHPSFLQFAQQPGRMSLTMYLGESVLLSLLFCGYGLGIFGDWGAAGVVVAAVATWACLELAARVWLARWRQGPLEALLARWSGSSRTS